VPSPAPYIGGVEVILGPIGEMNGPLNGPPFTDEDDDDNEDDGDAIIVEGQTGEEEEKDDGKGSQEGFDASRGSFNTGPLNPTPNVNTPVTSGGDAGPGNQEPNDE